VYRADEATHVGDPADAYEAERVAWHTWAEVRTLIAGGEVPDGPSLLALTYALATGADT